VAFSIASVFRLPKELFDINSAIPNPNGEINYSFKEFVMGSKNSFEK